MYVSFRVDPYIVSLTNSGFVMIVVNLLLFYKNYCKCYESFLYS